MARSRSGARIAISSGALLLRRGGHDERIDGAFAAVDGFGDLDGPSLRELGDDVGRMEEDVRVLGAVSFVVAVVADDDEGNGPNDPDVLFHAADVVAKLPDTWTIEVAEAVDRGEGSIDALVVATAPKK